jgi:hypothetical protein
MDVWLHRRNHLGIQQLAVRPLPGTQAAFGPAVAKTAHVAGIVTLALGALCVGSAGCTRTYETRMVASPIDSRQLVRAEPRTPIFQARLRHENGLLVGELVPTLACRFAHIREHRSARYRVTKPNTPGIVAGVTLGGIAVAMGAAVYSGADHASAEEICRYEVHHSELWGDSFDRNCSSPREDQQAAGIAAIVLGGALVATAAATALGARNGARRVGDLEVVRRERVGLEATPVACYPGKLSGVRVSIRHDDLTLGDAVTNAEGKFAFVLPQTVEGRIDVVVEKLPDQPGQQDSLGGSGQRPSAGSPSEHRIILSSPDR